MAKQTAIVDSKMQAIVDLTINGLDSEHSRRAYEKALSDFLIWHGQKGKPRLNKATIQDYRSHLQRGDFSASTINVRMSAIRKLATEAADNGLIDQQIANGIARVRGVKSSGVRAGNWLTKEDAQRLLNAPDTNTLKGKRDQAIIAVLLGAGLRRSECAALTMAHIQQREGRWAIVDIVGKRNKIRTVPIASWVKVAIDHWTGAAHIVEGAIFRGMNRHGQIINEQMSDQAIGDLVTDYGRQLGMSNLAAHDLRRSFAKLARKAGCPIEQLQLNLGHGSINTTKKYLGDDLDFDKAASDFVKLSIA